MFTRLHTPSNDKQDRSKFAHSSIAREKMNSPYVHGLALTCILSLVTLYGGLLVFQKCAQIAREALAAPAIVRKTKKKDPPAAAEGDDVVVEDESEEEDEVEEVEQVIVYNWGAWLNARIPDRFRRDTFVLNGAVLVFAFALGYWLLMGNAIVSSPHAVTLEDAIDGGGAEEQGLGPVRVFNNSVHYFLSAKFGVNMKREMVPLVSCQHYPAIDAVHAKILGARITPLATTAVSDPQAKAAADPMTEYAVDNVRERARGMCVLEQSAVVSVDDHEQGHSEHLARLLFWELQPNPQSTAWFSDAPIEAAIVTEHGERYYRVMMVQKNVVGPMVVSEKDLLNAAHEWYFQMMTQATQERLIEDDPCICAEHFGILGSGLFFTYAEATQSWRVELHTGVTRNMTQPHRGSHLSYSDKLPFPYPVDKKYAVGDVPHYGRVMVTYLDPVALFETPKGRSEVQAELNADRTNALLNLASLVNLTRVMNNPASSAVITRELVDFENGCYHHCHAMATVVAQRAGAFF